MVATDDNKKISELFRTSNSILNIEQKKNLLFQKKENRKKKIEKKSKKENRKKKKIKNTILQLEYIRDRLSAVRQAPPLFTFFIETFVQTTHTPQSSLLVIQIDDQIKGTLLYPVVYYIQPDIIYPRYMLNKTVFSNCVCVCLRNRGQWDSQFFYLHSSLSLYWQRAFTIRFVCVCRGKKKTFYILAFSSHFMSGFLSISTRISGVHGEKSLEF